MTRAETIELYKRAASGDNGARHLLHRRQQFLDDMTIADVIASHDKGIPNADHARFYRLRYHPKR